MFRVAPPPIIRSTNNCVYSIWYFSHRYCYLQLSWKSWNWFECAVGGVCVPSSNSSTIAAGSYNGVTNTRRCRYSCLRSWWWVVVPLETCSHSFPDKINCVTLYLVRYILQYFMFSFALLSFPPTWLLVSPVAYFDVLLYCTVCRSIYSPQRFPLTWI